ncbi:MAG TPA: hypothetical protein VJ486_04830 [Geothrix sp.]|nr:hypothetical protein [Geothrix sp.]
MRLGPLLLAGAALTAPGAWAQGRPAVARNLDWERVLPMAWVVGSASREPALPQPVAASSGPLLVRLAGDGTLQIQDQRGRIRLKTGLPGRSLRVWRDGGVLLPSASGEWGFPVDTPLKQGVGSLQWCSPDFRPFLQGLLWVLEDSEAYLSVIHPATGRVIHVPLPPGRDLQILFLPDRLEVLAGEVDRGSPRRWSMPWMGFLPRLSELGPQPKPAKLGSALIPFPKE